MKGIGSYIVSPGHSYTYKFQATDNPIANLVYVPTTSSSTNEEILVNGNVVKEFNTRVNDSENSNVKLVEFNVPTYTNSNDTLEYEVTIKNNDLENDFYLSCFNFKTLKNYNNEYITDYKGFGTGRDGWIISPGASDYAYNELQENDLEGQGELRGSYHGEEYLEEEYIDWNYSKGFFEKDYTNAKVKLKVYQLKTTHK